jgi:hypothetical protein
VYQFSISSGFLNLKSRFLNLLSGEKIKVARKVSFNPKIIIFLDFIDLYRVTKNSGNLILISDSLNIDKIY